MKHFDIDPDTWEWANFVPKEIACKCCGEVWEGDGVMPVFTAMSLHALQKVREAWGKPIIINSGHRCAAHNAAIGGAPMSYHLRIAFDVRIDKHDQVAFAKIAKDHGFTGIIYYPHFMHIDCRPFPLERVIP